MSSKSGGSKRNTKGEKIIADNRKANYLFSIEEVFEAEDGSDGNSVGEFAKDFSYSCQDGSIHKLSDFMIC